MDSQNGSLHIFHAIAVQDRIRTDHLDNSSPSCSMSSLTVANFLPSKADYSKLRETLVVLIARVVVDGLDAFKMFRSAVPEHIAHPHSTEMATKSAVGSLPSNTHTVIMYQCTASL